MRLGAMLVRDGRLTAAQVLAAVGQQARVGGRIGTVLIEMRLIDADTLTVYLGLDLGVPIATRTALERAKRAALRALPVELAERLLCIPLVVQDRQLIVAMRDPHDLLALDELATATSYRIIPRVAPEVRLYYYLEKYYGVARPQRFRALGETIVLPPPMDAETIEPPPPLPGLPPALKNPRSAPRAPEPLPSLVLHASVREAEELARQLEAAGDEPALPPTRRRTTGPGRVVDVEAMARAAVSPMPGTSTPPTGPPAVPDTLDLDAAVLRMTLATTRSEIADALLAYARALFDVAILLIVRDELAFGWKGFGHGIERDRLETVLVPLEVSSMFKAAVDAGDVFAASPPASILHLHVLKVLRSPMPARAVVAPVVIKERVVNLLYGHVEGERTVGPEVIEGLRVAAAATANGYVRLIALHKHGA
jgi:hypothetical protein